METTHERNHSKENKDCDQCWWFVCINDDKYIMLICLLIFFLNLLINYGITFCCYLSGMNPLACKQAIEKAAKDAGIEVPVVAAIVGDDLMPMLDELKQNKKLTPFSVEVYRK